MKPALASGCLATLLCIAVSWGADLAIANRAPAPDEVGYRPADGDHVRLNPPSLVWLHEKPAATYSLQWAQQRDFTDAQQAADFPWNTYTHSAPLAAGTWFWRYRFKTAAGATSAWSIVRSVTIPTNATTFPTPTRTEQRARVPASHPRLFCSCGLKTFPGCEN